MYEEDEYFEHLKSLIKDEGKSKVIMSLFFDIYPRFNRFHWTWTHDIPQDKPRLVFCALFCESKDKQLVDDTLEFVYSSFNFKDSYKESIIKINLDKYDVFLVDIATLYHMINPSLFAVKKSFAYKINLYRGEKKKVIGKNDFEAQDNPQRNPLHPDSLSVEQKIRIGLTHKKALEFVRDGGKFKED